MESLKPIIFRLASETTRCLNPLSESRLAEAVQKNHGECNLIFLEMGKVCARHYMLSVTLISLL